MRSKKGFTLVELLIVIAIVAILATVSIIGYTSFIDKANQSVDEQAIAQINKALEGLEITDGKFTNISQVIAALKEMNLDIEDYKPLKDGMYFYWVAGLNRVIYADANDNIVYPEGIDADGKQWMSLSGNVPLNSDYEIVDGKVTIDDGAKLAHLIGTHKDTATDLTITLSGNVDLRGAAVDFGRTNANITIDGGESGATLSGLRADQNSYSPVTGEFAGDKYYFGLLGKVDEGTVIIKNVTISGLAVGNINETHEDGANSIGLVAGYIAKNAEVILENVTFRDCSVTGYQKVGGIVGQLHGKLTMKNVKFENVSVSGVVEVAKVAGIVSSKNSNGSLIADSDCNFDGITVKALKGDLAGTFRKSDIDCVLNGNDSNVYGYWDGADYIFGIVTEDLAWYRVVMDPTTANEKTYQLNSWVNSTSSNIVDGVPQS